MSYENAPATKLLATHCAVCSRPLVDAESVDTGIGPECRKRHGYNTKVTAEQRTAANKLVHDIALAVSHDDHAKVTEAIKAAAFQLPALGFTKLADVLVKRSATITIAERGMDLTVDCPYREELVVAWRGLGRWDREAKCRVVPPEQRRELWTFLKRHYAGALGVGPKGVFVVQ